MYLLLRKTTVLVLFGALFVSFFGLSLLQDVPFVHAADWYNSSWQYRVKVTIDHTKVTADQTNFPVYVDLSNMPTSFFAHVKSDGGDIRVTESDGLTEVPREVVAIDTTNDTGELHFKASTLSSTTDFGFYIYYGNASATEPAVTATYGRNAVWSNNFVAVYHMQRNPGGTAPQEIDSTGGGYDLSSAGSMTSSDVVGGKLGKSIDFDGSNDGLTNDSFVNTGNSFTVAVWVNSNSLDAYVPIVLNGLQGSGQPQKFFLQGGSANGTLRFQIRNTSNTPFTSANFAASNNQWYSLVGTYNGSSQRFYMDGVQKWATSVSITTNFTSYLRVADGGSANQWNGQIDEIRISNSARDSSWVATTYNNQNAVSTFESFTAEESAPVVVTGGVMSSANYQIVNSKLSIGGIELANSPNYQLSNTIGQVAPGSSASANYNLHAGYRHMGSSSALSISLSSSPDITLSPQIAGISGGTGNASTSWTVSTTNTAGYTLSLKASTAPALQTGSGTSSASFSDYAASTTPDFTWSIASTTSAFGFTPEGTDIIAKFKDSGSACNTGTGDTASSCWVGFSTTAQSIAESTAATTGLGTETTVRFRAEVGAEKIQPSGSYTASITATALSN